MSVHENDLMILESYLDDELSPAEADDLRERLGNDAALSARLHELREQRQGRAQLWQGLEPSPAQAAQFAAGVQRQAHRLEWKMRGYNALRWVGSAAALVALGFGAGWLTHQRVAPVAPSADSIAGVTPNREIRMVGSLPTVQPVKSEPYQVVLTDDSGKVIGVQMFNSQDKARQFTDDLDRWHNRQNQLRDGRIKFVSEEQ